MLLLFLAVIPLLGQGEGRAFQEKINLSIFGGIWSKQTNTNNNGWNIGAYADYLPYKSSNGRWTGGIYSVYNHSNFKDNLSKYDAKIEEYGLGLTGGYYYEGFSTRKFLFLGFSLGWKHAQDKGSSQNRWGKYEATDEVELITSNINFNLISRFDVLLPRTQILISLQAPLSSNKKAYWEGKEITSESWDRTYGEVLLKQSIINLGLNTNLYLSPKLIAAFAYSKGDNSRSYSIGVDLSLHKQYKDDFLSVYCLYKIGKDVDANSIFFGLNFSPMSLIFGN